MEVRINCNNDIAPFKSSKPDCQEVEKESCLPHVLSAKSPAWLPGCSWWPSAKLLFVEIAPWDEIIHHSSAINPLRLKGTWPDLLWVLTRFTTSAFFLNVLLSQQDDPPTYLQAEGQFNFSVTCAGMLLNQQFLFSAVWNAQCSVKILSFLKIALAKYSYGLV